MDYSKGKIYKITDIGYNECYYGSTIQPLSKRMGTHRSDYKAYKACKEGKYHGVTSYSLFDKYGLENCKIELVEECECKTKEELHQREGFYIRNNECVNKRIPDRTKKEWRDENKEQRKEYDKEYNEENKEKKKKQMKEYYEENKEKLKEKMKEYNRQRVTCEICNKEMCKDNLTRHKKLHK
jgi:hypothetical protein